MTECDIYIKVADLIGFEFIDEEVSGTTNTLKYYCKEKDNIYSFYFDRDSERIKLILKKENKTKGEVNVIKKSDFQFKYKVLFREAILTNIIP